MKLGKTFFRIHSWLGLLSGVFILIFSLTGAIIVFREELNAWEYPTLYRCQPGPTSVPLDSAYQTVLRAFPEYLPYGIRHLPKQPGETLEFGVQKEYYQDYFSVFVNPYTGQILGTVRNSTFNVLLKLHYTFYLKKVGELLAAVFALAFMGSMLTGVVVYRKYVVKALLLRVPIKWKNWRTASSDLHRVLGVWALGFNFVLALSGFVMMRYALSVKTHFTEEKPIAAPRVLTSIGQAVQMARQAIPGLAISYISLPRRQGDALRVMGDVPGGKLYGDYQNQVDLDPTSGTLLSIRRERYLSRWEKFENALYTLHFGQYGGKGIKLIYCFFGLVSASLSITGFLLWIRRKGKRRSKKKYTPTLYAKKASSPAPQVAKVPLLTTMLPANKEYYTGEQPF